MGKKGGGFFDNPFGGFFDFDGDGKESLDEQFIGFNIVNGDSSGSGTNSFTSSSRSSHDDWRLYCEDGSEYGIDPDDYSSEQEYDDALEEAKHGWRNTCEDGSEYGVDPMDYETEDEYEDALNEEKHAWRDTCEDGSEYGVDPEDFDTEDEYQDELNLAKYSWRLECSDGLKYGIDVDDYETREEYEAALEAAKAEAADKEADDEEAEVRPEDYPNKRKYNAAVELDTLKYGIVAYNDPTQRDRDYELYDFILNHPEITASNYVTVDRDFLFGQAIKDHFTLPFPIEDEDERQEVYLDELLVDIARKDPHLALQAWEWCADTLFPYRQYTAFQEIIPTSLLKNIEKFPNECVEELIEHIEKDTKWMQVLAFGCDDEPSGYAELTVRLLQKNSTATAKAMLEQYIALDTTKPKNVGRLFSIAIEDCKNHEEVETMELLAEHLFPIIKNIPLLERKWPEYQQEIEEYIDYVETHGEKYKYSRKYAWRVAYKDDPPLGIDPLDYETRKGYLDAVEKKKYEWRRWYSSEEKEYGILTADFETEKEYLAAVEEARQQREAEKEKQRASEREKLLAAQRERHDQWVQKQREREQEKKQAAKSITISQDTDKTVYLFYGVKFPYSSTLYYYRSNDDTLDIGDKVIVRAGTNDKDIVAEIYTVEKHRRATAPYPVDKARFIIGRADMAGNATDSHTD